MSHRLDPELIEALAAFALHTQNLSPAYGDWRALREAVEIGQAYLATLVPPSTGVEQRRYVVRTGDGAALELRWYAKESAGAPVGPAVVYSHGGGAVAGTLDLYNEVISWYVDQSGVPFLSVGYRRAPDEGQGTTLAEDVFCGLLWLVGHAAELGVDPTRIALMGDSGGAGPAAGAAILARDRGVPLARQILVYPMLDDRDKTPDPLLLPFLTWTYDNNCTAWHAVLGEEVGTDAVSPIAAPARLRDFRGLAPAYLDTGDLDIFRDETIAYATRLDEAGVAVELHVHPGAPHGWERFAPHSGSARRAMNDRARVVGSL